MHISLFVKIWVVSLTNFTPLQRQKYCDQITAIKKVLGLLPAMFPWINESFITANSYTLHNNSTQILASLLRSMCSDFLERMSGGKSGLPKIERGASLVSRLSCVELIIAHLKIHFQGGWENCPLAPPLKSPDVWAPFLSLLPYMYAVVYVWATIIHLFPSH